MDFPLFNSCYRVDDNFIGFYCYFNKIKVNLIKQIAEDFWLDEEELIRAVTAGWSGNVDYFGVNLGLFGMGFNIATARLGRCTTIKTTKSAMKVWFVLKIDFDIKVFEFCK